MINQVEFIIPIVTLYSKLQRYSNQIVNNAIDTDIVKPIYNSIEYSDNYSKPSASLWQYYTDVRNDNLADSESFKSKIKITGNTPANGNKKMLK